MTSDDYDILHKLFTYTIPSMVPIWLFTLTLFAWFKRQINYFLT